ncbi:MAG: ATP-dependent DNA helicase RecG, partial [Bacteroidia bacterium]
TYVEIGLTIPSLSTVVIMHPERFGLQQLHQIRGRLAREGGHGDCYLYLPKPLKSAESYERLRVMEQTSDGFEIAKRDMELRGIGDVSRASTNQHGTSDIVIKNIKVTLSQVEWMVEAVKSNQQLIA